MALMSISWHMLEWEGQPERPTLATVSGRGGYTAEAWDIWIPRSSLKTSSAKSFKLCVRATPCPGRSLNFTGLTITSRHSSELCLYMYYKLNTVEVTTSQRSCYSLQELAAPQRPPTLSEYGGFGIKLCLALDTCSSLLYNIEYRELRVLGGRFFNLAQLSSNGSGGGSF